MKYLSILWSSNDLQKHQGLKDGTKFPTGRICESMSSGVCCFPDTGRLYWVKSLFWSNHRKIACISLSWGPFMSACVCAVCMGAVVAVMESSASGHHCAYRPKARDNRECVVLPPEQLGPAEHTQPSGPCTLLHSQIVTIEGGQLWHLLKYTFLVIWNYVR